jgi:menaquinone-dependent protoporphyrinogen oxidase
VSPHRILIVYGTSYGQTAKIAREMARVLTAAGHTVTLVRGDELPPALSLRTFDGVIIGASVLRGHHQRYIERFVRRHCDTLSSIPSAFFSVSGAAASQDPRQQEDARRVVDRFLTITQWHPRQTATVAGAMAYTKYSPLMRLLLKYISRRNGGPTDTSRDHEFTDWTQVERFAADFVAGLSEPAGSAQLPWSRTTEPE